MEEEEGEGRHGGTRSCEFVISAVDFRERERE